jgi:myo-inositol-1(or 4)-monophosphatase
LEDLSRALQVAREAARAAGQLQRAELAHRPQADIKGRFDRVTEVDRQCERLVVGMLRQSFPAHGLLAEEYTRESLDAAWVWLVDPLDGTINYTHGYPIFAVSLALRHHGETALGVVYDPNRDEWFEAVRGAGATLNGRPIRVSQAERLGDSLLATGFPYDRADQPDTNLDRFAALTMQTLGVRRSGSASLDLCNTACGRLDGYWEIHISPWDVGAGALLVQEAGGRVTNLTGGPFDGSGWETVASNGRIHQELIEALARAHPTPT